jgi:2-hydroxychromene-2-carboxylate isomerase
LLSVQLAMDRPTLYFDLGSPYAYLAAERATAVLGVEPRLQPVLVGGIFLERGHGSWGETEERAARIAEIEARAERYGLPPMAWPEGWPNKTLKAMRATIWAGCLGAGDAFARAGFRHAFRDGADLSRIEEIVAVAASIGLPADDLPAAIEEQTIKDELRAVTQIAWDRRVIGVPCIELGGKIFFGDDHLEPARHLLDAGSPPG